MWLFRLYILIVYICIKLFNFHLFYAIQILFPSRSPYKIDDNFFLLFRFFHSIVLNFNIAFIFHFFYRGLYLGYLKLRTSVDTLSIIVPNAHTNVLPHVKIQDVPNVTRDQWEWLQSFNDVASLGEIDSQQEQSEHYQQPLASSMLFERKLKIAIRKLFNALNISTDVRKIMLQHVITFIRFSRKFLKRVFWKPICDVTLKQQLKQPNSSISLIIQKYISIAYK